MTESGPYPFFDYEAEEFEGDRPIDGGPGGTHDARGGTRRDMRADVQRDKTAREREWSESGAADYSHP